MKKTIEATAVVFCLLFFLLSRPALAQEASQHKSGQMGQEEKPEQKMHKAKVGGWIHLADGLDVVRIKRLEREGPEFAILDLSEEKYEDFKETPKEFVNKYKIFSQPVRELKACCSSETTEKKEKASDKDPYVVVSHWPGSKATYATFPSY